MNKPRMRSVASGAIQARSQHPMRRREAELLVFPSVRTGDAVVLVRNHRIEEEGRAIDAQIALNDDERRQLIDLLGGRSTCD